MRESAGIVGDAVIVAYDVSVELTCTASGRRTPDWFVNETEVVTEDPRYGLSTSINGVNKTATLAINGSHTRDTLNIHCEVYSTTEQRFLTMHNYTLMFQGEL